MLLDQSVTSAQSTASDSSHHIAQSFARHVKRQQSPKMHELMAKYEALHASASENGVKRLRKT